MTSPARTEPTDEPAVVSLPLPTTTQTEPSAALLGLLAVAAGLGVANHLLLPAATRGDSRTSFHVEAQTATVVATATQLGYAAGLWLIVPLADSLERKRLMVACTVLAAVVLAVVGVCTSIPPARGRRVSPWGR